MLVGGKTIRKVPADRYLKVNGVTHLMERSLRAPIWVSACLEITRTVSAFAWRHKGPVSCLECIGAVTDEIEDPDPFKKMWSTGPPRYIGGTTTGRMSSRGSNLKSQAQHFYSGSIGPGHHRRPPRSGRPFGLLRDVLALALFYDDKKAVTTGQVDDVHRRFSTSLGLPPEFLYGSYSATELRTAAHIAMETSCR